MKARNMINILLVGDPGVSKSQLLTYVHKVRRASASLCSASTKPLTPSSHVTLMLHVCLCLCRNTILLQGPMLLHG